MKSTKLLSKVNKVLCSALILLAPAIVSSTGCFFIYGEPECPNCLKNN